MSPPRASLEDELGQIAADLDTLADRVQAVEVALKSLEINAAERKTKLDDLALSIDRVRQDAVSASKELRDELKRSLEAMRVSETEQRTWWRGIIERVVEAGIKAGQALVAALCGVIGLAGAYYFAHGP